MTRGTKSEYKSVSTHKNIDYQAMRSATSLILSNQSHKTRSKMIKKVEQVIYYASTDLDRLCSCVHNVPK